MKWVLILLTACGSTHHDTLDSIPSAAAVSLRRVADGAKIEHVEREGDRYEASWRVGGLEREATVTASGELVEHEEEVPSAQVPAVVRAVAIAKLPAAQTIKFVKLINGNYEAEAIADGKEVGELVVAPDGQVAAEDEDGDDDDD